MLAVLLLVVFSQGAGLGLPHDTIPDLIQPSPSAGQDGANRAPEGAITMADDAQSGALRYCKVIAPSVVVVRICFRLGVGVGVECASAGMLTVEDNIRGGDEAVEVDEDGAATAGECCERGG